MNYNLLRHLLFKLKPEAAHSLTLNALNILHLCGINKYLFKTVTASAQTFMGLTFKNTVGLAAGLDKNADYLDALADLGFGFIEVGTVTPLAQVGNPKPRLFRIPEAQALINRMGFNNKGIDYLIEKVKRSKYQGVLGINIGKNAMTSLENANNDYLICLRKAYPYASYITINISSPNTMGLRNLQQGEFLTGLLKSLKQEQVLLATQHQKQVPLVVKIAPDLTEAEIIELTDTLVRLQIEGIIATNTTIARENIAQYPASKEAGGLSGAPLTQKSNEVLKLLSRELKGKIPLIATGGIMTARDAQEKIAAGASLIQLYTGLIYRGPQLINDYLKNFS
jgi:dihydroorotate dehydrogenase